ncbi:MAG: chemotaxis protein CheB [Candidatus Tectomicrobia bacterium]|nr:chemotaxis protein CheB [Candidatus Tectomicrobia bacterium]
MSTTRTPNSLPPLQEEGDHDEAGLRGQASTPDHTSFPSYLVGIGASAGGLEALTAFFDRISPHSGLAFVVVQHLSPDFKSLMHEVLARHTQMAIHWAADRMFIEANTLYLMPPLAAPAIAQGRFQLREPTLAAPSAPLPIDTFLGSLAADMGDKAIGMVLSGIGRDGALGIRAVKQTGGMVMVQTPDSAAFDGMPRQALATGMADVVAPPDEMARALLRYAAHPPPPPQWKLFQKTRDVQLSPPITQPPHVTAVEHILERIHGRLVALYGPPTLVVNEQQEVVHMSGDVSPYLRPTSGIPDLNVLQLLIDDLALPVQTLLKRIATEQDKVVHPHIAVRSGDESRHVTLRGHWVPALGKTPNLALLCFETAAAETPPSTLADLQLSHVALQCRHEAILASHAELQSTNETLQVTNEVLYAVNVEYRKKIAELTQCHEIGDLSQPR